MRHMTLLAAGLAAVIGGSTGAAPAFAEHGAIAYDRTNCDWGRSWNYDSQTGANNRAQAECTSAGGTNCQVLVEIGRGLCGALASTPDCGGDGWATRSTESEAQLVAMQQCRQYNPGVNCVLQTSVCSKR